jgi:hypothetical protein
MGLLDKLLGREKKDAGDMAGDASAGSDGMDQGQGGMAEGAAAAADEHSHDGPETPDHEH